MAADPPVDPSTLASFWLMPAEADAHLLAAIVGDLSARFGTEAFAPHLTIVGDIAAEPDALLAALAGIAAATAPFAAPIVDVVTGSTHFKSLFAAFDRSAALDALRRAAKRAVAGGDFGDFMPHLSLLYGHPPEAEKSAAAERLRADLVGRSVTFDRVVVTNSSQVAPVGAWRVIETARLG